MTSPEVERAVFGAHTERQVGRAVLESASPGFQPGAKPSQLPTQRKKPGVAVTPGFDDSREVELDHVSQAQGMHGAGIRRLTDEGPRISAFGDT